MTLDLDEVEKACAGLRPSLSCAHAVMTGQLCADCWKLLGEVPALVAEVRRLRGYMAARFFPLSMREGMADPVKALDRAQEFHKALQDRAANAEVAALEKAAKVVTETCRVASGSCCCRDTAAAIRALGEK